MPKFAFRLQKVLEYRQMEESMAKDQFLAAQAARVERQTEIRRLMEKRSAVIEMPATSLHLRIQMERLLEHIDSEERSHRAVLAVLETEESQAQVQWNLRRQAVKAIEKLEENAKTEWKRAEDHREQSELDEWAVTRRPA
jgi:flagellar export protein FliJ